MKIKSMMTAGVLSVVVAAAGCSGGDPDSAGTESGATTITWQVWAASQAETAAWQQLGDMVTKKYPDIKVKLQTSAWNDYWTKLPTLMVGNDVPCVVGVQMARLAGIKQFLQAVDDKAAAVGISPADFDPAILKALSADGKQYAYPYDLGPYIMYYNKTAFTKAGLPLPANGWTIDQWLAAAHKLTQGSQYGFAASNGVDILPQWGPTIAGVQAVDDSGKLALTRPEVQQVLDFYAGLVSKEKIATQISSSSDYLDTSLFLAGNAATVVGGPWDMINIKSQAKFDVGVVTVPVGARGPATSVGGSGFGITAKCKQVDAAAKAISVLTGPEALARLGQEGRAFPARPAQQSTWYAAAVEGAQPALEAAGKGAVPYLSTADWTQVNSNWTQGVVPVINEGTGAANFLKSVQSQSAG